MVDITDLTQIDGLGKVTAEKLKTGGVLTIMSIATSTPGQLGDAAGVSEAQARKFITGARALLELGFESARALETKQEKLVYIPTHCEPIDKLLGGGLRLGSTLEAFGGFSSGKTNLSHLLAVSCIKEFPESYVIFIDTENTFSAKRIREYCKGLEMDPEHVLSHIRIGKAISSDHQILLTETVEREIIENKHDVKLLIVDSLMNHFRAEYLGRGTLSNRQQTINGYLHKIGTLVANYNLAVYMTNQVQSDPASMFGDPNKAIGGNIVGHFATIRVYLRKGAKGSRVMKLIDSPDLPEEEVSFIIEENRLGEIE
jgi:DNA repair protein RadA